ncbi:MAG: methylmalonyl-CoA mutase family protein [Chloroflexota bacterium]|nr:methylmalonyl-CoA mutase family protein [Chloroflexota bacterium]
MTEREKMAEIAKRRKEWEEGTLRKSLERFGAIESPNRFYTPLDIEGHDFLEKVGFPGEYPFTTSIYPTNIPFQMMSAASGASAAVVRAGNYSGYGTAEDTRDYHNFMATLGHRGGPNIAFDLPTQCGHDSDEPVSRGEVGKVGVAVDTLRDFETIYEAFQGERDLDKIASNFTINAPTNVIVAMYMALAEQRGIPIDKLRGTPQNDILKEFVARGTYIFPPGPSMRMTRDTITFCTRYMPLMNPISICGYHMREAGASAAQAIAFTFANGIAYVQLGVDAGLDVDEFMPRFTFLSMGGSMDFYLEIARARAARRMWARIMRERFKAKNPRSWLMREPGGGAHVGRVDLTSQRPLNNLTRTIAGGIMSALSGGPSHPIVPYDEPLGLGHSLEAQQLVTDGGRILQLECKLNSVIDPFAGSYFMESLTDQVEEEAWDILHKIDDMGGAVAAIEKGFMQREVARSAYDHQRKLETGEKVMVGVNRFTGEQELEVNTQRLVEHPYDPKRRDDAEEKQLAKLAQVKRERDNEKVQASLARLTEAAKDEDTNLIPVILESVKAYASIGEICGVLRQVFGEYQAYSGL